MRALTRNTRPRSRSPGAVALTVIASVLLGCGASQEEIAAVTSLDGDGAAGLAIYERECRTCHGADGRSGSEDTDIVEPTKSDVDGAVSTILVGDGSMPAYEDTLADQEIADVIAYVRGL